jgi:hypothetical protein
VINWQGTVISQYNQSPTIQTLLYAINQWIDPKQDLEDFYNFIWNVDTARGYGLDVWGRIVAVGRVLKIQTTDPYWGFNEATVQSAWPFNTSWVAPTAAQGGGIFYSNQPLTANYVLNDEGYRTLILAKAMFNITNGSIPSINQILINLFASQGRAYVVDNQDMSISYIFEFQPTPVTAAIISQSGVIPRPTGVSVTYSFNPSTAAPYHVGSVIGGIGGVQATADVVGLPVTLRGVATVRASATTQVAARGSGMAGRGGVAANAVPLLGQKLAAAARIDGVGTMRGVGPPQVRAGIGGVGSLSANASIQRRVLAFAMIDGRGGVHASSSTRFSVPIRGAGSVRANGTVQ